ncbi:MAG: aminoacyl-tRNA hydrolase [Phascolarctobacterium sp.]|nr:aminoacyl-tRNA hydrolase [Phascolarctobacterium sp.]
MKLIVGLGNIGKEYENTRHNIGFMVVDELASRWKISFGKEDRSAYCAETRMGGEKILLIKPTTYMNLSGFAVGAYANFFHIEPENIAVVQDDMDMTLGQLRIRSKGSAGGHNGIKSIIQHLGTEEFPRFKVGIGHPDRNNRAVINHVLTGFYADEKETVSKAINDMASALEEWVNVDLNSAMQKYNTKKAKKSKKQASTQTEDTTKEEKTET